MSNDNFIAIFIAVYIAPFRKGYSALFHLAGLKEDRLRGWVSPQCVGHYRSAKQLDAAAQCHAYSSTIDGIPFCVHSEEGLHLRSHCPFSKLQRFDGSGKPGVQGASTSAYSCMEYGRG
jgi:hypothetical protein